MMVGSIDSGKVSVIGTVKQSARALAQTRFCVEAELWR